MMEDSQATSLWLFSVALCACGLFMPSLCYSSGASCLFSEEKVPSFSSTRTWTSVTSTGCGTLLSWITWFLGRAKMDACHGLGIWPVKCNSSCLCHFWFRTTSRTDSVSGFLLSQSGPLQLYSPSLLSSKTHLPPATLNTMTSTGRFSMKNHLLAFQLISSELSGVAAITATNMSKMSKMSSSQAWHQIRLLDAVSNSLPRKKILAAIKARDIQGTYWSLLSKTLQPTNGELSSCLYPQF